MIVGDPEILAFEIGESYEGAKSAHHITIWAANRRINPIDDVVYLPAFWTKLDREIRRLGEDQFAAPEFDDLSDSEIFASLEHTEDFTPEKHWVHKVLCYDISTNPATCYFIDRKAGNTLIKLMEIESPPAERKLDFQAGVRWLTFIIEDVPSTVHALKAKGVEFMSETISALDAKYVVCAKGPDGMLIEFVQLPD